MNIIKALFRGREASVRDVAIDTAGVFLGILIILAIVSIYQALKKDSYLEEKFKKKEKRSNKKRNQRKSILPGCKIFFS